MLNKILKFLMYAITVTIPLLFLPFTFEFLEFNKLFFLFFFVWLATLVWIFKMIFKDKEITIKYSKIDYFVLGFSLINIISYTFSVDKMSSLFGYYGRFSMGIISTLSFAMFYFLIKNLIGTKEERGVINIENIFKCLLASNVLVILIGYLRLLGFWSLIGINNWMVRVSTVGSSIESLGIWLVITVILSIFVILDGFKWSGMSDKPQGSFWKWLCIPTLILSTLLLIVIDSFLVWITLIIGLVLFVLFVLKKKLLKNDVHKLILPIGLIILSVLFIFISFRGLTNGGLKVTQDGYINYLPERTLTQEESWTVAGTSVTSNVRSAAIGNGPGTFFYSVGKYRPASLNDNNLWAIRFDRSGNVFSEVLASIGVIGFLCYLAIWIVSLIYIFPPTRKMVFRKSGKKIDTTTSLLLILLLLLVIVQVIYYQTHALALLWWLVLGLLVGWYENEKFTQVKRWELKKSTEIMLLAEVVLIILALLYIVAGFMLVKVYLAEVDYVRALNNPDLDKKVILLDEARELNPQESRYLLVLSKIFLEKAKLSVGEGATPEAVSQELNASRIYANAATKVSPNKASTWEELATLYIDLIPSVSEPQEFIDEAVSSLERSISLEPYNLSLYNELGSLYSSLDQNDEAFDYFNKALEIKENFIPTNINISILMEEEGNITGAIEKLEWLKGNISSNATDKKQVHFYLGRLYYERGRNEDAANEFINALNIDPNYANALYSAGLVFEEIGNIEFAIAALERVLVLNPEAEHVAERINRLKSGDLSPIIEEPIDEI
jgi:putative inorganic carbon (hco3(-)) transporter